MLLSSLIIGTTVNGASRWINIGFCYIQPAEFSKLSLFCYISNYLSRKIKEINNTLWSFSKPISITIILSILLIIQPDFGTVIILVTTTLTVLFLAGARIYYLLLIIFLNIFFVLSLILISPYRIRRIIYFWDPWLDPFDKGYQLTNSLMAFGRGSFWGQGLGNSLQKLNYLPEAHTDFVFSIVAEEMGYIGIIIILLMIFFCL